ncbi:MAG: hypothetical protein WEA11_00890 [Acidimicrobiales bacterium]
MLGRRVGAGALALALALMIGLSGCSQDNSPTDYNTLTQQNFLELCTNLYYSSNGDVTVTELGSSASTLDAGLSPTQSTIKSDVTATSQEACLCMYSVFVNQMPINKAAAEPGYSGTNFTDLNSKLKSNPEEGWATVSEAIKSDLTACANGTPVSSSLTSVPSTPTTVAG